MDANPIRNPAPAPGSLAFSLFPIDILTQSLNMSLHHGRLAVGQPTNESRENENQLKGPATTACIPCGTWWMLGPQCYLVAKLTPKIWALVGGLFRFWNVCCVSAPRIMRTWMPWSSLSWSQRARPSESHQLSCLFEKKTTLQNASLLNCL